MIVGKMLLSSNRTTKVSTKLLPVRGGSSYALSVPKNAAMTYLDGPIYPNGCQVTDFVQGSQDTCHVLAVLEGIAMKYPAIIGELIWEEGDQVCAVFMSPTYGANRKVSSVTRNVVKTDRWVSQTGDSLGKAPYVALWVKLFLWLYGGTSYDLLNTPRDPREDIWPLGFNVEGAHAADMPLAKAASLLDREKEIMVCVTRPDAPNLVRSHVYVMEFADAARGIVMLRNTWGVDGPCSWGDIQDGRVLMPWATFIKNVDAFRWSDGLYWTPTGKGPNTLPRLPNPTRPLPISVMMP